MQISELEVPGYEQVLVCRERASGLRAVIAIHDSSRGPAVGGCRMWPYASLQAAVDDALRLSQGMSYKSAFAGLHLGGGKAVLIGDPAQDKSEALLRAFGRCIDALDGRYVVAEDVGVGVDDIEVIGRETHHVAGRLTGGAASGDPSPFTARGVLAGMRVAVASHLDRHTLRGTRVAIQGIGKVGMALCHLLHREGARLLVGDTDAERVKTAVARYGVRVASPSAILEAPTDVLAPCAMGGVIDAASVPRLGARVIAGAANNQLALPDCGDALARRGILYVPDFVLNAGGIVNVAAEIDGDYDPEEVSIRVDAIGHRVATLLREAAGSGMPPHRLAGAWAEQRLSAARARTAPPRLRVARQLAAEPERATG